MCSDNVLQIKQSSFLLHFWRMGKFLVRSLMVLTPWLLLDGKLYRRVEVKMLCVYDHGFHIILL